MRTVVWSSVVVLVYIGLYVMLVRSLWESVEEQ